MRQKFFQRNGSFLAGPERRVPGHTKARWSLVEEPPTPADERPPLAKGRLHKKYYLVI